MEGETLDRIVEFVEKYFLDPIKYHTGYNVVNTVVFAIILYFVLIGTIKLLKKINMAIDSVFLRELFPLIIAGSTTRALVDAGVYPNSYPQNLPFVTPGIYLTTYLVWLACVLTRHTSKTLGQGLPPTALVGLAWAGVNTILIIPRVTRPETPLIVLGISLPITMFLVLLNKTVTRSKLLEGWNIYLVMAHMFDAASTFVGLDIYGEYVEQHVVPTYLISLTGTSAIMFILKLVILLPTLYLLDKHLGEDQATLRVVKLVILILGIGPGTRNTLRMMMTT
ncbi:MAG: hypothetical protein DRO11_07260 [Methanobacteriota archaeon]|nr:MAG: hypothetical protein DRO11_07260 [Euryarchaeota archaeon]